MTTAGTGQDPRPSPTDIDQLKQRMRATWMAGDFGQVARYAAKAAEEFVDRLPLSPGMRVLDVACGTGNLAIPAARKGTQVTGIDIAPNLVEQARQRAADEGVSADFQEGDAEQLPFRDAQFDLVMTMFGAMFAPRPEKVASELARVCRPRGIIAMANWTPEGFVGKTFQLMSRHVPPPAVLPAPVQWGNEDIVRERLAPYAAHTQTVRRSITVDYPFPPRQVVQFFRDYFGPTQVAFSRLDAAGQSALAIDLENIWHEHNQASNGRTVVSAEYLEVIAQRA